MQRSHIRVLLFTRTKERRDEQEKNKKLKQNSASKRQVQRGGEPRFTCQEIINTRSRERKGSQRLFRAVGLLCDCEGVKFMPETAL